MREIVVRLTRLDRPSYVVGGVIRDLLLGRKPVDWDVATLARPEEVCGEFEKVIPTGIAHGTVTVLNRGMSVEVTTFRGEGAYSDGRHPDRVVFLESLEEDLKRRDFTINAIAYDIERKTLLDPFGGQRDLQRRVVRAVGNPMARFSEDGLRPLRAVRFASILGFSIEKKTFSAIRKCLPVFRKVAPERVREELLKMLAGPRPERGIEMLRSSGLLGEILPELLPGFGFAQNRFHRHDVYRHALACLRHSRGDPVFRLAVLLHDIGKVMTAAGPPGMRTFYNHEKVSAQEADDVLARLRFSNDERRRVRALIENHMIHYEPAWSDGAIRRLVRRIGRENLEDAFRMQEADVLGRGRLVRQGLSNLRRLKARIRRVLRQDAALKVTDLAINGSDVMRLLQIEPGPRVGRILTALLEHVTDSPKDNSRQRLEELVRLYDL
ncbi:MAG: HD domain-containing protein [Myxococcales bacterium]|nr:HD domain-containing protein [Myxococcales bacterium]